MRQVDNGFTLIELALIVGVVGILAAIAIPSYQDYVTRAQLSEAVSMTAPLKIAMGEACMNKALNGANNASLALPAAADFGTTKVITSITAAGQSAAEGTITVLLKQFGVIEAGQTLVYKGTCSAAGMQWGVDASSTLPVRFKPKN